MQTAIQPAAASHAMLWTGRVLSGLIVVFMLFDGVCKVIMIAPVKEACAELGIPESVTPFIGIVLIGCTCLYAIPQTSMLGAILLTGYLGGAVATHVRMGGPAFPIVFATLMGVVAWCGLYVREPRLWALVPLRR
jgi:DoxX-like protein